MLPTPPNSVGKPGVPDDIHKLLLRIYESQDDLKKALEQAAALLKKNPNDAAARAKIEEFRKELDLKPGEGPGAGAVKPAAGGPVQKTPGGKAPPPTGAVPTAKPPKAGNTGGEGLEAQRWKRENWGQRTRSERASIVFRKKRRSVTASKLPEIIVALPDVRLLMNQ